MKLNGIDYGPCWDASGVRGFFGEGYWYHRWLRFLPGFSFRGSTFVAKTTTLRARLGNMSLNPDMTPRARFPKCIVVKWRKGVALNSVGLSGPGAATLLLRDKWQARTEPFLLSFMSVKGTRSERLHELDCFVDLLAPLVPTFKAPFALQVNLSCPNTKVDPMELISESITTLGRARRVGVPIIPKVNVLFPLKAAVKLQEVCDGICVSNTIPWGKLPDRIDWEALFGRRTVPKTNYRRRVMYESVADSSPLAHLGGGGLSGWPLLGLTAEWVMKVRQAGFTKPINAGGGILCARDVGFLHTAGANSVFVGSVAFLRPWRLASVIRRAHALMGPNAA